MRTTHVPEHIRKLRSEMELKDLSLREVSELSGVGYSVASAVLTGRLFHPTALEKIGRAIKDAPIPQLQPA
jgi:hypothetical protein